MYLESITGVDEKVKGPSYISKDNVGFQAKQSILKNINGSKQFNACSTYSLISGPASQYVYNGYNIYYAVKVAILYTYVNGLISYNIH